MARRLLNDLADNPIPAQSASSVVTALYARHLSIRASTPCTSAQARTLRGSVRIGKFAGNCASVAWLRALDQSQCCGSVICWRAMAASLAWLHQRGLGSSGPASRYGRRCARTVNGICGRWWNYRAIELLHFTEHFAGCSRHGCLCPIK